MKKIREVKPRDLKKLLKLEKEVFSQDAFSKDLLKKLIFNNTYFLVLCEGRFKANIIGFLIAIKDRKDRMNIINFLVSQKYQNKGNGSLLLKKVIELTENLNEVIRIILNVKTDNQQAINLYKDFNFRIIRKIEGYYSSGEDSYLMEKYL